MLLIKPSVSEAMTLETQMDVETIAEKAAQRAVKETFLHIGINLDNPLDAQRDFYLMREIGRLAEDENFRKDLQHIRSWRLRTESATRGGVIFVITAILGGFMTTIWAGIQVLINKH